MAAIYDQYGLNKITVLENLTKDKLQYLKIIFAEIASLREQQRIFMFLVYSYGNFVNLIQEFKIELGRQTPKIHQRDIAK